MKYNCVIYGHDRVYHADTAVDHTYTLLRNPTFRRMAKEVREYFEPISDRSLSDVEVALEYEGALDVAVEAFKEIISIIDNRGEMADITVAAEAAIKEIGVNK